MSVEDAAGMVEWMPRHGVSYLRQWRAYVAYLKTKGKPLRPKDYKNITYEEYTDFTHGPYLQSTLRNTPPPPTGTNPASVAYTPVELFRRGIKRDPTAFTTLKTEQGWDQWNRNTRAVTRAQGCGEVLDETYTPVSTDEIEVFAEKQIYMFSVFIKTVLTDVGKKSVRAHEAASDAQAIYLELVDYHTTSVKSTLDATQLLHYITNAKLGTGSTWKGSTQSFLLHYQEQFRLYESITDKSTHMADPVKKTLLENAVSGVHDLNLVKTQAEQIQVATSGAPLDYKAYSDLLLNAAISYDNGTKSTASKAVRPPARAVFEHELLAFPEKAADDDPTNVLYMDSEGAYDIDSHIDTIHVNAMERPGNIPTDRWNHLSDSAKTLWKKMTMEDRMTLLGVKPAPKTSPSKYTKMNRSTNLHDMSAYDLLELEQALMVYKSEAKQPTDTTPPPTDSTVTTPVTTNDAPLSRTAHSLHPGDLRRMLVNKLDREVAPTTKTVTIDGKTYRQVNMNIVYNVYASSHGNTSSLVDRGSNGGVGGQDVRVIHFHPHQKVDIQGLDNHRLNDIRVATVGGIVMTTRGLVVAVFPHYAYTGKGASIHSSGHLEWFGTTVDDKSVKVGGTQCLTTLGGLKIPLDIVNGLPRLPI